MDNRMDEVSDKLRLESWWNILKALPMDGGPSSTKFVYLALSGCICGLYLMMTATLCYVVAFTTYSAGATIMAGLLGTGIPILVGFASNSLNQRRALQVQAQTQAAATFAAGTPAQQPGTSTAQG